MKHIRVAIVMLILAIGLPQAFSQKAMIVELNSGLKHRFNLSDIDSIVFNVDLNISTTATKVEFDQATIETNLALLGMKYSRIEFGVCYSGCKAKPSLKDSVVRGDSIDRRGIYRTKLSGLTFGQKYNYRSYVTVDGVTYYAPSVGTFDAPTLSSLITGGDYVDLGLSVKWATKNMGASVTTEMGDQYAWGETSTKSTYEESNYVFDRSNSTDPPYGALYTKYYYNFNSWPNGPTFSDWKTRLEAVDDAATANLGTPYRMPTRSECKELMDSCRWVFCKMGTTSCYLGIAKNKNTILFPLEGQEGTSDENAIIWSSDLYIAAGSSSVPFYNGDWAWCLCFSTNQYFAKQQVSYTAKYRGLRVRAVCPK